MPTYETTERIGDALVFDVTDGDTVTITTPEVEALDLHVAGVPDTVPDDVQDHYALFCHPTTTEDDVVELHATITEVREMATDYDVFAIRVDYPDDDNLGPIRHLTLPDS